MANERRPLALSKRRGIHLGDKPREAHPREQLGVDIIPFVVRLRNRPEPARMREHEVPARPLEQLVQPRPRRAGLHDGLERTIRGEQLEQSLWLADLHARGSGDALAHVVDDDHDDIPCMSIDSSEKHVGLLVGKRTW
jgi:hypothetical protein